MKNQTLTGGSGTIGVGSPSLALPPRTEIISSSVNWKFSKRSKFRVFIILVFKLLLIQGNSLFHIHMSKSPHL
jgi:hypothetical protein